MKKLEEIKNWNIVGDDNYKITFKVPVGNPKKKWWQFWKKDKIDEPDMSIFIEKYKEEINWDDNTGEITINGTPSIPYQKEYWFPTND